VFELADVDCSESKDTPWRRGGIQANDGGANTSWPYEFLTLADIKAGKHKEER
jgi:hypothetical protein